MEMGVWGREILSRFPPPPDFTSVIVQKKYPYSTRAPVNLNATLNCLAFSSHLQEMSPHFQLYCQLLISLGSCAVFQSRDCERQRINQTNSMAPGSGLL